MLQEHLTDNCSPWYLRKISSASTHNPAPFRYTSAKCPRWVTILQGVYPQFFENTGKFSPKIIFNSYHSSHHLHCLNSLWMYWIFNIVICRSLLWLNSYILTVPIANFEYLSFMRWAWKVEFETQFGFSLSILWSQKKVHLFFFLFLHIYEDKIF